MFMNCGQSNINDKLRFKDAEIWFAKGIMKILWTERKITKAMNVARDKKITLLVQDLQFFLKIYTRNI